MRTSLSTVRVGAGLSTDIDPVRAAAEAATDATIDLTSPPDLIVVFFSVDHRDGAEDIAAFFSERFQSSCVLGTAAEGIVGGTRELEQGPALSVWAATLPDTSITPFRLDFVETGDGEGAYAGWPEGLANDAGVLLFADPYSFPVAHLLATVNETRLGMRVIGGVASGVRGVGEARLLLGHSVETSGAVAVAIHGRVRIDTLVSQGCRPIGTPATITRADRHIIFELAGERPIDLIGSMWKKAEPHERALMQSGLFIGRVVDEYKSDFARGDFLIRTVVGADPEQGFVAVGDVVNVGETIQFHVRDPDSAGEDLHELLSTVRNIPAGALLFTCNGRGSNMFSEPDHDATLVSKGICGAPLAGFFANGELGPVGGKNFLHGHTASIALFIDTYA